MVVGLQEDWRMGMDSEDQRELQNAKSCSWAEQYLMGMVGDLTT